MKKYIKIILVLMMALFLTTGCTERFVDEETQKSYTANIMCKPSTDNLKEVYEKNAKENNIDISKLPTCSEFKITSGEYENLFTSLITKPLAFIILKIGEIVKNYGIAIMIVGLLIRLVLMPLTKKSLMQSENLKKAQPEIQKLEKKYRNKNDKDSLMMKSQETMMIYKKYDINPMSGCLFAFLQLPILFAFLEAINRIPAFFEENLWKFQLGTTPLEGLQSGNYFYLIIVALIILTTYFSFKNMNMAVADPAQQKQMKFMSIFMLVFISIASFSLPVAIALYWIVSSVFSIIQNIYIKDFKLKKEHQGNSTKKDKENIKDEKHKNTKKIENKETTKEIKENKNKEEKQENNSKNQSKKKRK